MLRLCMESSIRWKVVENAIIPVEDLKTRDQLIPVGRDYIPGKEALLRNTIFAVFSPDSTKQDFSSRELLAEAVFWSIGELINNANKANNRWAILHGALFQKASQEIAESEKEQLREDIDYAIQHNQTEMLKKYGLSNVDLTASILRLIEKHKTNSFALSEQFKKKIDVTLRIKSSSKGDSLILHVINNSPITVIDRERVEYNLTKIKEDLIEAGKSPFEAAVQLYEKSEDHRGGGFGAGLRSIVLFLKEGYGPFPVDIVYSRLIQYRSAANSTIFSIELPVPAPK